MAVKLSKVNLLLFISIMVMAVTPLLVSLYFVDNALQTSLNLGFNSQISRVLDDHATNLKALGHLDTANQDKYRQQFEETQNLRTVYESGDFVRKTLHHSLLIYFLLGLVIALVVSVLAASLLSRKISSSFRVAHEQLAAQHEKIRYLEEISSWQELAKILAHEIKNPLTPIEMLMTSLSRSYREQPAERFAEFMTHTQNVILEELKQLKDTVQKFSAFSQLPSVHTARVDMCETLTQQATAINNTTLNARIVFARPCQQKIFFTNLDTTLFRQVLNNLVLNGVEANPGMVVVFSIAINSIDGVLAITVMNDGVPIDATLAPRIFDPYVSSKRSKDKTNNMGLGLAIVRKIMLEHAGDIRYEKQNGYPAFILTLPAVSPHE